MVSLISSIFLFSLFNSILSSCCTNCDSVSTSCTSCSSGYYLYNSLICLRECPEGYSISGSTCILTSTPIFINEDFSDYTTWSVSSIGNFNTASGQSLSLSSTNSLIVTKSQGLYSTTTSVLKSNTNWVAAPDLSILIWVLAKDNGHIFEAAQAASVQIRLRLLSLTHEFLFRPLNQPSGSLGSESVNLFSSTLLWELITIKISQTSATTVSLSASLNNAVLVSTSFTNIEASYVSTLTWTLGCVNNFSFKGFIYKLLVTNEVYSGTLTAPSVQVTCDYNQYYDGSSCGDCPSGCSSTWPWCTNQGSCSSCYNSGCSQCSSFLASDCLCSNGNVYPYCCYTGCADCSVFWTCSTCDSGYNLIGSVCLDYCPTGDCSGISSTAITNIKFDKFLGNFDSFISGNDELTFNPFNNGESDDPLPIINRGLYFTTGTYLKNSQILLAHTFTIAAWVLSTSGNIFTKGSEINLSHDGTFTLTLLDKTDSSALYQSSSTTLSSWSFVTISLSFSSGTTSISCALNTASYYSSTFTDIIFREVSKSPFIIGSSYVGFVFSIKIWNCEVSDFSSEYNDDACGSGLVGSCLDDCGYDEYWDGLCVSCLAQCTDGCRNGLTCNICEDQFCSVCTSFVGDCSQCTSGASGSPCSCNTGYFTDGYACTRCNERCSVCSSTKFSDCTTCKNSYTLWKDTYCLLNCPTGYSDSCLFKTNQALSLILNSLTLSTSDSVTFGSNSKNYYPNFDDSDPIPTKSSGYYFLPQSYMTSQIVLAPTFSINFWVKVNATGEFISKSSTFSLTLDSVSTLVLYFSYSSSQSINFDFTIGTWEYVSVVVSSTDVLVYLNQGVNVASQGVVDDFDDTSLDLVYFSQDEKFAGFLYSVHVLNEASRYENYFGVGCVSSSVCLSSCEFGEDSFNDCEICPEYCTKGCYSGNCILCSNDLCKKCTNIDSCINCIENSTLSDSICSCNSGTFFNHSSFTCEPCTENCESCNSTDCLSCTPGYFISNSICSQCPQFCTSCNPNCTSCSTNAILSEGSCYCPIGYNNETCEYARFNATLSRYGSSQLLLYFTEPLQSALKSSDFQIKIDSSLESFKLTQESSTKYLIQINFTTSSIDQTLLLTFLTDIVAANNALLDKKTYSLVIAKSEKSSEAAKVEVFKQAYTQAAVYGAASVVALSSVCSNPAALWSFINTIQLLCFATLSGVDTTPEIQGVLEGLRSYYLFPNTIEYVYQDDSTHPYDKAKKLGFETNSLFINVGKPLTAFAFFLVYYFLFFLLSKCDLRCNFLNEFVKATATEFKYGFFIRYSIQNYLEICVSCLISIFAHDTSDVKNIINLSFSILFSVTLIQVFMCSLPIFCMIISEKNRKIEHKVNKDEFKSLYGTLFYEFNSDENMATSYYYTFFFTRRLLYSIILFSLLSYPIFQMTTCIILSLAVIHIQNFFYLLECKPFSEPILNYSNMFSELGICIFFFIYSFLLFDLSNNERAEVDSVLKYTINIIMGIQMLASLAIFTKTIYKKIKQKNKVQVIPEQDQDNIEKQNVNNSLRSVVEKSCDEAVSFTVKHEEFLKKRMFDESTVLSPRIRYK